MSEEHEFVDVYDCEVQTFVKEVQYCELSSVEPLSHKTSESRVPMWICSLSLLFGLFDKFVRL